MSETNGGKSTVDWPTGVSVELTERPSRIGAYRIISVLGRGAMGVVYRAEQTEPVRREVALKVLKTELASDLVVARFNTERQALAVMEHPNITKVFDAGITETGWPYFVMERVDGVGITEYADAHHLSVTERIGLFIQICHAVQHAHQKGIIHRDLKPSNILVTDADGAPLCKVIDFGIAKATDHEQARLTGTGISIGTPAYMSPEQGFKSSLDIDTRSDIYSLGVVLYELVAGVLPFDPATHTPFVMLTQHATVDPPRPSARFGALPSEIQAEIAQAHGTEPSPLLRELSGDLDFITLKALEKERERRYETPNAFAADLERFLEHKPISARAPTARYLARKFVRRHRFAVAFVGTIGVLLVGFTTAVLVQAQRLAHARTVAVQRQGQAEDLITFMVGDLRTRLASVGRFDVMDEVVKKSQDYYAAVPETELSDAELFRSSQHLRLVGDTRVEEGNFAAAMDAYRQSLGLAMRLVQRNPANGEWQLGLGASHFGVGLIHWRQNDLDSAMAHFVAYRSIAEELVRRAPDSLTYRFELASAERNIGAVDESAGNLRAALSAIQDGISMLGSAVRRDTTKLEWQVVLANNYNAAGVIERKLGDLAGGEQMHRAELAAKLHLVARDSTNREFQQNVALARSSLGEVLVDEGNLRAGIAELRQSRDLYAQLAASDPSSPERRRLLAIADRMYGAGELEATTLSGAVRDLESSRSLFDPLLAATPTNRVVRAAIVRALAALSVALDADGRRDDGVPAAVRAVSIADPALGEKPSDQNLRISATEAHLALANADGSGGDAIAARREWTAGLTLIDSMARATSITEHLALRSAALLRLGRLDEARPVVEELWRRGYRRPRWAELARQKGLVPSS